MSVEQEHASLIEQCCSAVAVEAPWSCMFDWISSTVATRMSSAAMTDHRWESRVRRGQAPQVERDRGGAIMPASDCASNPNHRGREPARRGDRAARSSITLDEVVLMRPPKGSWRGCATSQITVHTPSGIASAKRGRDDPVEVNLNVPSLREEFTQDRLAATTCWPHGRLVPTLADVERYRVRVPGHRGHSWRATIDSAQRPSSLDPLSAFVDQVDAPTIVAARTHLIDG